MTSATSQTDVRVLAWFTDPPRAAYVHIPFCAHKCGYCDFASVAGQDELIDRYLAGLDLEMASILSEPADVETIFVGGGTPTYPSASQIESFLSRLRQRLRLAEEGEFTIESNPNTLTPDKVKILADHGVNRVSLGAQSFHPRLLAQLERNHDPDSVPRAVDMIRRRIDSVSIDLIFGIPGQSMEEWAEDLYRALALDLDHLSAYGLTYEKGTLLWKQRRLGLVQPIDESLEADMYEHAIDLLNEDPWRQYEISNYARLDRGDRRCRHNLVYWDNESYYGFGTGAAAYVDGRRTLNLRPLVTYLEKIESRRSVVAQSEELDPESRARETAILQLRRLDGLNRAEFLRRTGFSIDDLAGDEIRRSVKQELLHDDGMNVRLTRRGLLLADGVLARIV